MGRAASSADYSNEPGAASPGPICHLKLHRLTLDGVRKSSSATAALRAVSLGLGEGEVHPLIAGNGPEGQRKLAGGRAKRKPPDHVPRKTMRPGRGAGTLASIHKPFVKLNPAAVEEIKILLAE
jgi:hypothetical protein